ncbi:MAG: LysR family transcriptional regulator [Proteobacteria bacterium]|nr:LysR family transcriptional regulator [Pseudomonadota bacterium]MBW3617935.1 LysR family transcriptional regulator [Pseudomonadota bacterium]
MRLRQIEIFYAVYRAGSISAAARELNVSQPSVSKMLKHTEDQLGFLLFTRVKGRLTPTDEAHALYREVKEVFERLGSLKQTAGNLRARKGGHIRLAVLPALGLGVAPEAIARFRRANPGVTFDVQTLHHDAVLRALYEREADLALAFGPLEHPRLSTLHLGWGELRLLFSEGQIGSAPPDRVDMSVLAGKDYIGSGSTGPVSDIFAAELERHELAVQEVITVGTYYMAVPLVRLAVGMAVVDEFTARSALAADLESRPFEPALRFGVHCIHLADRPPSHLTRSFIEVLRHRLMERTAGS